MQFSEAGECLGVETTGWTSGSVSDGTSRHSGD